MVPRRGSGACPHGSPHCCVGRLNMGTRGYRRRKRNCDYVVDVNPCNLESLPSVVSMESAFKRSRSNQVEWRSWSHRDPAASPSRARTAAHSVELKWSSRPDFRRSCPTGLRRRPISGRTKPVRGPARALQALCRMSIALSASSSESTARYAMNCVPSTAAETPRRLIPPSASIWVNCAMIPNWSRPITRTE